MTRRYLAGLVVGLFCAPMAEAQWTTTALFVGTPWDIPVGVAVRAFGSTGDVVFALERRDGPNSPGTQHFMYLDRADCTGTCATPGFWPEIAIPPADVGLGLGRDQSFNASLALRGSSIYQTPPPERSPSSAS